MVSILCSRLELKRIQDSGSDMAHHHQTQTLDEMLNDILLDYGFPQDGW